VDDLHTLLGRLDHRAIVLDLGCGSFNYEACCGRIIAMDLALPNSALHSKAACLLADGSNVLVSPPPNLQ
jgi:hypothetical protein